MTDHPIDAIEAYALGDLPSAEAGALLAHADACPVCAPLLGEAMAGVAALGALDGDRAARGGQPKRAARRAPRAGWYAAGAATAAALVLGVWNVQLHEAAPLVPVDALVHSHFTHHPLVGEGGDVKVLSALDGSWIYAVGDGLRPHATYALSIDGTFVGDARADGGGDITAYFTRPKSAIRSESLTGPGCALHWP